MSLDVYLTESRDIDIYHAKITHNLGPMAAELGIYKYLWRPEEIGTDKAWELIAPLTGGLNKLRADPEYCKQFNAANSWGTYDDFVNFVENYLAACIENPDANVRVSR